MKAVYFDCFAGIAGDMIVGAMLDAGLPFELLEAELKKLNIDGWKISANQVNKHGITATKFNVHIENNHHHHRNLHDIVRIIDKSTLDNAVKQTALKIFKRLAVAEAKVHGTTVEEIHFHEVGAVDAIIDIVGASIGIQRLGVERVIASPITTGTGFVNCAHGKIPVPAPAAVELLHGVPYRHGDIPYEMATPTGAAILTTICSEFGSMPEMITERVGYGAGDRELPIPNLLRIHIGELKAESPEQIQMIETNIDDMNPEFYNSVVEKLLKKGALDVYINQVLMKKGRPGVVLHVLSPRHLTEELGQIILEETTSIGYRCYPVQRRVLDRKNVQITTAYGKVGVKVACCQGKILNAAPEYEDCLTLAKSNNIPVKQVYASAIKEFFNRYQSSTENF